MNNIDKINFENIDYHQAIEALPKRQKEVLYLVAKLIKQNGYSPSLAELAHGINVRNRMTINQHLEALKRKGLLNWNANLKRSLKIQDEAFEILTSTLNESFCEINNQNSNTIAFPISKPLQTLNLVGTICAGSGIEAIESPEKFDIEDYYAQKDCYVLKVKGESMIGAGIYDSDFVIVKPNPNPNNGDIVVALMSDNIATLKRFYKENGKIKLVPENPEMETIIINNQDEFTIQGVVVGLFRRM